MAFPCNGRVLREAVRLRLCISFLPLIFDTHLLPFHSLFQATMVERITRMAVEASRQIWSSNYQGIYRDHLK